MTENFCLIVGFVIFFFVFFATTKIKKFVIKNILATFAKKYFFMKGKLLFIVVLLISLASCTSVRKVTSIDEYY